MTSKPTMCVAIEPDLIAAATGEATPPAAERVDAHVATCAACRDDFARYRAIDHAIGALRSTPAPAGDAEAARQRLIARLADLRSRIVSYRVAPTPLGPMLMARSEQGIALLEYLGPDGVSGSRLLQMADVEAHEGGAELESFERELLDYRCPRTRASPRTWASRPRSGPWPRPCATIRCRSSCRATASWAAAVSSSATLARASI